MQIEAHKAPFSDISKKVPPKKPTNQAAGRSREYLTESELDALMEAAKAGGKHGYRDYVLVLIAYRHGLRVGELVNLKWQQIDFHRAEIHVNRLKHGDSSVQPLYGVEVRALRRLQREYPNSPFVLCSQRGGPLTERAVHRIIATAGRKAKIAFPVHPHMLRHSTGFKLAQAGQDTRAIQAYLGHRQIQHTVRYTRLDSSRFKDFAGIF